MVRLKASAEFIGGLLSLSFQFHMVRLKEQRGTLPAPYFYISIPYGAIKSLRAGCSFRAYSAFQFHMVRLKAECPVEKFLAAFISIPYGAIKRTIAAGLYTVNEISIPYGAIKRTSCLGN